MSNAAMVLVSLRVGLDSFPDWFKDKVEFDTFRLLDKMGIGNEPTLLVGWYDTPNGFLPVTNLKIGDQLLYGTDILHFLEKKYGPEFTEKVGIFIKMAVLVWENDQTGVAINLGDTPVPRPTPRFSVN